MELNQTTISLIAQICEISTRMNVPATAVDDTAVAGGRAPEGAILKMLSIVGTAYITMDQLAAAKRILRIIYNANCNFFDPEHKFSELSNTNEDLADESISESFTLDDITDAIKLGVSAAKAHVEVRVYHESLKTDKGYLLIMPVGARGYDRMPFKHLGLVSRILEIVCDKNKNFKPQQS